MLIVSPFADSVVRFRGPVISELVSRDWEVVVLAPDYTQKSIEQVEALGAKPEKINLDRVGINPFRDLISLVNLVRSFTRYQPDVVFSYQHKPNIYGMLAAKLVGVPARYALIEGLGYAFTSSEGTSKKRLVRFALKILYKLALQGVDKVFFLNPDDREEFLSMKIVGPNQAVLLGGIGVELDKWLATQPHVTPITFTLVARLLREKGIHEYVAAASYIKTKYPDVRFLLIGPLDSNPGSIKDGEVKAWVNDGLVEWVPWTDDIQSYLKETSVYVLPSYREGVPRSVQEAMAMARPVITTDVPGCRETVLHGKNGYLIPPQDSKALIRAMEIFIQNPALIEKMGRESRKLAEERFDAQRFVDRLLMHMEIN